jgi:hypothetical protein
MYNKILVAAVFLSALVLEGCGGIRAMTSLDPVVIGCRSTVLDNRPCVSVIANLPDSIADFGIVEMNRYQIGYVTRSAPLDFLVRNQASRCYPEGNRGQRCYLIGESIYLRVRWYKGRVGDSGARFVGISQGQIYLEGGENPQSPQPWTIICVPRPGENGCY